MMDHGVSSLGSHTGKSLFSQIQLTISDYRRYLALGLGVTSKSVVRVGSF